MKRAGRTIADFYSTKAMEMMQPPGTRVQATELGERLGINSKNASMCLASMWAKGQIHREPILHYQEGRSQYAYYAERKPHNPALWSDVGLLWVLGIMGTLLSQNLFTEDEYEPG